MAVRPPAVLRCDHPDRTQDEETAEATTPAVVTATPVTLFEGTIYDITVDPGEPGGGHETVSHETTISATGEHPFLVARAGARATSLESRADPDAVALVEPLDTADGRWVPARDLAEGDTVRTMSADGVAGTATVAKVRARHAVAPVYNLTIRGTSRYLVGACGVVVHNKGGGPGSAPLGRGSTADPAKGTTLPRNLREQLAVEEAMSRPGSGSHLEELVMTDARWHHAEGWIKMQQIVRPGGGDINVHYVWNRLTGAVDDFKIIMPGSRPSGGPCR